MASPISGILKSFAKKFKRLCSSVTADVIWGLQQNDENPERTVTDIWIAHKISSAVEDGVKEVVRLSFEKGAKRNIPVFPVDLSKAWDESGMTLSEKLHGADKEMRTRIVDTVKQQLKLNHHAMTAARALYDGYNSGHRVTRQQDIPKYLQTVVDFARRSDLTKDEEHELLRLKRKAERQVERLAQDGAPNKSLQAAYRELLQAVDDKSQKAMERAVHTAIEEKSRYVAERIARTEAARAWADGFIEKYADDDMVVAFRWELSSRHPHFDICNLYAEANLYGLGKGIYPKDKTPRLPVHPHCLCHLSPLFEGEIDGKKELNRLETGGKEWLEKQSLHHRQEILGIQGTKAFANNDSWTKWARNYIGEKLTGRVKELPESLKQYLHEGKIKIEEVAKRCDDEADDEFERRIRDYIMSTYCTKDFTSRQDIHIKGTSIYNPSKSYYDSKDILPIEKVRELLPDIEFRPTRKGDWAKKGIIYHPGIVGHWVSENGSGDTEYSTVHFSDSGIHIVPTKPKRGDSDGKNNSKIL